MFGYREEGIESKVTIWLTITLREKGNEGAITALKNTGWKIDARYRNNGNLSHFANEGWDMEIQTVQVVRLKGHPEEKEYN